MRRALRLFRLALWGSVEHDSFATARGAAYYSILTFFPALMILVTVLDAFERSRHYLSEIEHALHTMLPKGTAGTAETYFQPQSKFPLHVLISASIILLISGSGIVVSWMDGFLKAYRIPNTWNLAKQRAVAFALVVAALIPMSLATLSVAFGDRSLSWLVYHAAPLGPLARWGWQVGRWIIASITNITVLTVIYHFGIPRWQAWYRVLPGAISSTILWFLSTELFGWYAIRYASYNLIYGPLGVAIALLVWMYILSYIVVVGAEFNAQFYPRTMLTIPEAQPVATQNPDKIEDEQRQKA